MPKYETGRLDISVTPDMGWPNERYADASITEVTRKENRNSPGHRVIGGDHGDLWFDSFETNKHEDQVYLHNCTLVTHVKDFDPEEAEELMKDIFIESFRSIGWESIEHS